VFSRIDFKLGRSRIDLAVKASVFGVALCALVYAQLQLHWFFVFVLVGALLVSMDKRVHCRFLWDMNVGSFKLYSGDVCRAVVRLSDIRLLPGWVVFKVHTEEGKARTFVIFKDAIPEEEYRKLRVALKYASLSFEKITTHS